MKTKYLALSILALTSLGLAGCPSDDTGQEPESTTGDDTTTGTTVTPPTTMTTMDLDTTASTTAETSTTATDTGETSTTGPDDEFEFDETPFDDYVQVDRMGFPAINTGLNLLGDKDTYNVATLADDTALMFNMNIRESLETLHLGAPGMQTVDNTGLDDDLILGGFTPCITPPLTMSSCDDQGAPFAIPDTLTLDLDDPPAFPNGRPVDAVVMDVIFAVLLLDLEDHDLTAFTDLDQDGKPGPSVNPLMNDVEFPGEFPYLAPAHE